MFVIRFQTNNKYAANMHKQGRRNFKNLDGDKLIICGGRNLFPRLLGLIQAVLRLHGSLTTQFSK